MKRRTQIRKFVTLFLVVILLIPAVNVKVNATENKASKFVEFEGEWNFKLYRTYDKMFQYLPYNMVNVTWEDADIASLPNASEWKNWEKVDMPWADVSTGGLLPLEKPGQPSVTSYSEGAEEQEESVEPEAATQTVQSVVPAAGTKLEQPVEPAAEIQESDADEVTSPAGENQSEESQSLEEAINGNESDAQKTSVQSDSPAAVSNQLLTAERVTSTEPISATELKPAAEAISTTEPVPATEPIPATEPVPTAEPEPATEPVPSVEPEPTTEPVPSVEPEPTTEPEQVTGSEAEAVSIQPQMSMANTSSVSDRQNLLASVSNTAMFPSWSEAWICRSFDLPADFTEDSQVTLLMGIIDDMDVIYINGQLVASSGFVDGNGNKTDRIPANGGFDYKNANKEDQVKFEKSYWEVNREYKIPTNCLNIGGENEICIRVYNNNGNGGFYSGNPYAICGNELAVRAVTGLPADPVTSSELD